MKFTLTREFYTPTVESYPDLTVTQDDQSSAVVYSFTDARGRPTFKGFSGRKAKPDAFYCYQTAEARDKAANLFIQGIRGREQAAAARKAERNGPHSLKIGDVLYCSWGYSMTLATFYEVVATTAHGVTLEEIGSRLVQGDHMDGRVVAEPAYRTGRITKHRAGPDNAPKVSCRGWARPWDGESKYVNRWD